MTSRHSDKLWMRHHDIIMLCRCVRYNIMLYRCLRCSNMLQPYMAPTITASLGIIPSAFWRTRDKRAADRPPPKVKEKQLHRTRESFIIKKGHGLSRVHNQQAAQQVKRERNSTHGLSPSRQRTPPPSTRPCGRLQPGTSAPSRWWGRAREPGDDTETQNGERRQTKNVWSNRFEPTEFSLWWGEVLSLILFLLSKDISTSTNTMCGA